MSSHERQVAVSAKYGFRCGGISRCRAVPSRLLLCVLASSVYIFIATSNAVTTYNEVPSIFSRHRHALANDCIQIVFNYLNCLLFKSFIMYIAMFNLATLHTGPLSISLEVNRAPHLPPHPTHLCNSKVVRAYPKIKFLLT